MINIGRLLSECFPPDCPRECRRREQVGCYIKGLKLFFLFLKGHKTFALEFSKRQVGVKNKKIKKAAAAAAAGWDVSLFLALHVIHPGIWCSHAIAPQAAAFGVHVHEEGSRDAKMQFWALKKKNSNTLKKKNKQSEWQNFLKCFCYQNSHL